MARPVLLEHMSRGTIKEHDKRKTIRLAQTPSADRWPTSTDEQHSAFPKQLQEFLRWSSRAELSPLRYPGGKRRLIRAFLPIIANLGKPSALFVEPFAGGAAMSLAMLQSGVAEKVALADRDDLVGSFWKVVFSHRVLNLVDRITDVDVTLGNWQKIRESEPTTDLDRAFKCFFLNRTSFSGILEIGAGPIGGKNQTSEYKVGCRYNRDRLSARIIDISKFRDRVLFARAATYRQTISAIRRSNYMDKPCDILWYFDPPFFEKASKLYRHWFIEQDHYQLRDEIAQLVNCNWILSYDDVKQSRELYATFPGFYVATPTYLTAESGRRRQATELIVTNVPRLAVLPIWG